MKSIIVLEEEEKKARRRRRTISVVITKVTTAHPHDLLHLVFDHVSLGDYATFGAVCRTWKIIGCRTQARVLSISTTTPFL